AGYVPRIRGRSRRNHLRDRARIFSGSRSVLRRFPADERRRSARTARARRARSTMNDTKLVREIAQPLTRNANDYDALLKLIGEARIVLLGEASHGTHEFYFERAAIAMRPSGRDTVTLASIISTASRRNTATPRPSARPSRVKTKWWSNSSSCETRQRNF